MPLSVQSAIDTTFLDTAHFDVSLKFPSGFEDLDEMPVSDADGLVPFVVVDGNLKTQEFGLTCLVTERQEALLRVLYAYTIHPAYVDQRYPISISWGHGSASVTMDCYLAAYEPPTKVSYSSAEFLTVSLTLRPI